MNNNTQQQRRAAVVACAGRWCRKWYAPDGQWIAKTVQPDTRKTLWLMFGLLAGDEADIALANKIMHRLTPAPHHETRSPEEAASRFDIFVTNHCVQMLANHAARLDKPVLEKIEDWASDALHDYPGDRQFDYQFHGANDNMPAKAALGAILGGEYFGDQPAVEHGLWNLRQLRDMLTRRGLISEYTSPTYSALTAVNLTEISVLAKSDEARRLAALCVERVWADLLGHFHSPTRTLGGPFSRAYQLDSTGHFSNVACLLWLALGDRVSFDPIEELDRDPIRLVHHHDDRPTQLGHLAWMASCPYAIPQYLVDWLDGRRYPFSLAATAERGGESSSEISTTFYAEEDFALGTAEGEPWSELQSDVFFLQYKRRLPFRDVTDLGTVYARYTIDDQVPGDREKDHCFKPWGSVHTVQKGRMALVLARPVLKLAGQPVTALKFTIVLPVHFVDVERIDVEGSYVFVKNGPIHIAFRALNAVDHGCEAPIRVEKAGNYRLISLFNYEGPARTFTREELGRTLNGFAVVVGLESEESFESFKARAASSVLLDYYALETRRVTWELDSSRLSISYCPQNDRVRYATVDGKPAQSPLWAADGMPQDALPFLGARSEPLNDMTFPYEHLRVIWAPDRPWLINSRGLSEKRRA